MSPRPNEKPQYLTDCTVNGECSKCGNCCSDFLPMSRQEINQIKRYISLHGIKEYRNNAINGYDMTCPFRDARRKICTVYPVRPEICRSFMCNHSYADIMKTKADVHARKSPVRMRQEFFGNHEEQDMVKHIIREALEGRI